MTEKQKRAAGTGHGIAFGVCYRQARRDGGDPRCGQILDRRAEPHRKRRGDRASRVADRPVEDRRRRRQADVRRHLECDGLHRAADDLGGDGIDRRGRRASCARRAGAERTGDGAGPARDLEHMGDGAKVGLALADDHLRLLERAVEAAGTGFTVTVASDTIWGNSRSSRASARCAAFGLAPSTSLRRWL